MLIMLFRSRHFVAQCLGSLQSKKRENGQVSATQSHSRNWYVNHVFSGYDILLSSVCMVNKAETKKNQTSPLEITQREQSFTAKRKCMEQVFIFIVTNAKMNKYMSTRPLLTV